MHKVAKVPSIQDSRRSKFSSLLLILAKYGRLRRVAFEFAMRLEGGPFFSLTARDILARQYGVVVGAYSYGECMVPGSFPHGVTVGRYVSMARGIKIFLRSHSTSWLSMHPFFYNTHLGFAEKDPIPYGLCTIGHDSWIGERAIITPGCNQIGIGAVIGAGSVVTRDVPDFAITVGVPARIVRYRFAPQVCHTILNSKWWEKSISECTRFLEYMQSDLAVPPSKHPLLR